MTSKLPNVGTTIFTVMSKLANEHNAINLSQGFPNFPVDEKLTSILQSISTQSVHQYLPMAGYGPLLEQIAKTIQSSYHRSVNPNTELLVTAGATQGIYTTIQALVHPGQEVIIIDPCYDCYEPAIILAGGIPVHVSLEDDFSIDWNKIEKAFSDKTAMLIVNNPHNPSGTILKQSDIENLETILDSSFGKTFHITGWKVGYLVAPEHIMTEIKKVHQFLVFCVNSVAQVALAEYMQHVNVNELGAFYQDKRDLFRNLIKDSRFELLKSEGSYFQVASYKNISNENDVDFTKRLVIEHGVATIPMSVFNADGKDNHLIRFCYAKDSDTLIKAAEKLCKI